MRSNLTYQEYRHEMERSLSVTDEQWMFDELPDDLLDTVSLTEIFLESGGVAFGYPPFEKELFNVFHCWLGNDEDKFLKVRMYSRALIEQLPDDSWQELRESLTVCAEGDLEKWDGPRRDTWPGLPEEYLKNWDWTMHEFSSAFWEEKRAIKEARMDLIFSEKYPNWPKK